MSLTAESVARKVQAELYDPDHITVRVRTSCRLGFCLPDPEGDKEEVAVFNTMTFGDNYAIDLATSYDAEIGEKRSGDKVYTRATDINEYRRLLVKRNLLEWTLDIPIIRDRSGWMTPECYAAASRIPAPLMSAFVRGFEESSEVSDEEEQKISRQCAVLFSKSGHGVTDACEAVSKFCTLGNFFEKFGVNRDALPRMPYKEYLLLKIVIAKESDAMRVQHGPRNRDGGTKIVGPGGKSRPSRGIRIPMPGS